MIQTLQEIREMAEKILDEIATAEALLMERAGESPCSLTNSTQFVLKKGE